MALIQAINAIRAALKMSIDLGKQVNTIPKLCRRHFEQIRSISNK